jgi:hypothetical protein
MNTTSVKVFETRNSTYKCGNGTGDTLRFQIPPNVALLNPDQTYLKFDFCLGDNNTGVQSGYVAGAVADSEYYAPWTLNSKIGAESLIKELTISHNGQVLEQYFGYNMLCRVMANYTHNESMDNVVKLYKGGDDRFVKETNTLTTRTQNPAGSSKLAETQSLKRVECIVPLSLSGIFNGNQPFPNMVCPLEVQILLEDDSYKFLQVQGKDIGSLANPAEKDVQNLIAGYGASMPYQCFQFDQGSSANNNTTVELNVSGAGLPNLNTGSVSDETLSNYPFWVGQQVEIVASDGTKTAQVAKVENAGTRFKITFGGNLDLTGNATANPPIYVKTPASQPQATLSNVELICGVIQPNQQQSKALMSAVSSSGGYALDYKTYTDFPINQAQNVLKQSNLINCKLSRTKAIISYNENVGSTSVINADNLTPPLDSATKANQYQFRLNNILVPNRSVELSNYNKTRATTGQWEAIHIKELEDALEACGFSVRDLTDIDGALALGRGLSRGNNTYNMMNAQGETRLNVDYDTQTRSLLVHNWVCNIKRLVIKPNGIMVME